MISGDLQDKLTQCEKYQQELWSYRPLSPGLNAPALSKKLGRSLRTTQRYLKKLSDKKQIIFKGVAKNGGYEAIDN